MSFEKDVMALQYSLDALMQKYKPVITENKEQWRTLIDEERSKISIGWGDYDAEQLILHFLQRDADRERAHTLAAVCAIAEDIVNEWREGDYEEPYRVEPDASVLAKKWPVSTSALITIFYDREIDETAEANIFNYIYLGNAAAYVLRTIYKWPID